MQKASHVRLYANEGGESHYEALETELQPVDFAPPAAPLNVAEFLPSAQSFGSAPQPDGQAVRRIQPLSARFSSFHRRSRSYRQRWSRASFSARRRPPA